MDIELKNKKGILNDLYGIGITKGLSKFTKTNEDGIYRYSFTESE